MDAPNNDTVVPNNQDDLSLSFQPSGPSSGEAASVELPPVGEQTVENTVESIAETLPAPEVEAIQELAQVTPAPAPSTMPSEAPVVAPATPVAAEKPHVVDKRTYHEKLSPVNEDADPATKDADQQEADFIAGVELAHEHK